MEAVVNGASVREAAARFGVPKSTLGDRISGRVQHGDVSGPLKYLSTEEENDLAKFLIKCAGIGYPKTRLEVISLVQAIIDYKGIHSTVTAGWWQRFIKRNANITLRAPSPLSNARAYATDPDAKMPPYTSTDDTDDNSSSDTDRVTPLIYCSQPKKC